MKILRYKFYSIVFCLSVVLSGCSKDFLEKAPISNANAENFYKTEEDFELAINGAYASLRAGGIFQDNVQLIGELRSDNATMGSTASTRVYYQDISEFNDQSASPVLQDTWNDHYAAISRCNIIIDRMQGITLNESVKRRITGEAKFLRALFYFNLVRIFGDVPLVLNEITNVAASYEVRRSGVPEVYVAIEDDLTEAISHLPESYSVVDAGRATSGAAKALAGKVYLTQKKYALAVSVLEELINSNKYDLLPNFNNLWNTNNKNSVESLFEVQFMKTAEVNVGSNFSVRYTPYLGSLALVGLNTTAGGFNIPTEEMLEIYEENDLRKNVSVAASYRDQNNNEITGLSGRHTKKFLGRPTVGQGAADNWPVIRYADVLLMYAEALNEMNYQATGPAFNALNKVRQRAGLMAYTANGADPSLRLDNQQDFRMAVEKERRLELAFEGHRWYDLVRTGRAIEVMNQKGYNVLPHQLILPVPQQQIDINPGVITQNPGYN